jgi:hypothetical protein
MSETWQKFTEDHPESFKVSNDLMDAFTLVALRAPNEPEAAIFSRLNDDASTDFFFSPRLCELAPSLPARYFATPCDRPTRASGVGLLVGDQRSISLIEP